MAKYKLSKFGQIVRRDETDDGSEPSISKWLVWFIWAGMAILSIIQFVVWVCE